MGSSDTGERRSRVLFVYYTHTQQAKRVCDAMAEVLRARGWEVVTAEIEFTDPRYVAKFAVFPFRHAVFDILPLLWPQTRKETGEIRIPEAAREGDYDLVCFGSPTWWFRTCMPLRSYLKSDEAAKILAGKPFGAYVVCRRYWSMNLREVRKLGTAQGGEFVDGTRFTFAGRQIPSFLSLISYFGTGEMRQRSLGIKIPPTNLKPDFADQASAFANTLADRVPPLHPMRQASGCRACCRAGTDYTRSSG
jgi:flavodoxin